MPYRTIADLPVPVRAHLPVPARLVYRRAFNSAWETYRNHPRREEICHRVAWSAVKRSYRRVDGDWVRAAS
jgi:cation transport regulator